MTDIPKSTSSIFFCSYMNYIEWDMDKERYVSENSKQLRDAKLADIAYMTDDTEHMDEAGYEFLLAIEEDQVAKKALWKSYTHFKKLKKN